MKYEKLMAYAMDFSSFLVQNLGTEKIRKIVLFGSVARNEADEESDIDIFIDVSGEDKKMNKKVKSVLSGFYRSSKFKNYWNLLGVENEIVPVVGNIEKWDLKESLISNGITLYGKYKEMPKKTKHEAIFVWENIKPDSKRVILNKKLFGYKHGGKFYEGLLNKYSGTRLGKGCILVPLDSAKHFSHVFKNLKVTVKTKKFVSY